MQASEPVRASTPVLVPQAGSLGAVGVIRSLGRAGYPVHACADSDDALGLHSRYVRSARVHPPPASPDFIPWVRETVRALGIRAVVPSEIFLLGLRPALAEFQHLLPFFDPALLELAFSKADLVAALEGDPHLPPSLVVEGEVPSAAKLEALGTPLWLKADAVHARAGAPSRVVRTGTVEEARAELARCLPHYRRLLVQGNVPGAGVGVFFLMVDGHPRARFAHRRIHEVPHTGGVSSFRESVHLPDLEAHALSVLRRIGWNGVAMLEYRRDARSGEFRLLELNARFWGSLHLALAAGVDFPRLLLDAWLGAREPEPSWRPGVRCRQTVPGELMHVWSVLRDRGVSRRDKARTLTRFAGLSLDPRIHSDLWFPGDRALVLRETARWARTMGATAARRLRPRLKQSLYAGARAAGLFRLSRVLTRDALRIVCWHGTSLADEHRVFPGLFLSPDALERRLLALHRHPVLPLEEAVRRLRVGTLPPAAVALTIDDGFFGTLRHAWPALQRHGFPATLYATTYHVQTGTPVFRLLVQWICRPEPRAGARPVAARGRHGGRGSHGAWPRRAPRRCGGSSGTPRSGCPSPSVRPSPTGSRARSASTSSLCARAAGCRWRAPRSCASPRAKAWTCSCTPTATASPPHGTWRCASCVTTARCSSPPPAARSGTSATRADTTARCTSPGSRRHRSRARPPATRG